MWILCSSNKNNISQVSVAKLFEGETSVPEHIPRISEDVRRFPKIPEDFRVRPEDIIHTYTYFIRFSKKEGFSKPITI